MQFGPDPVRAAVADALSALARGETYDERSVIDFKEEAGRRTKTGALVDTPSRNEKAAEQLAGEVACMANTPGGGALVVGVSKSCELVGTHLDPDWLRVRIYELLDRRVTAEVRRVEIERARLLVIVVSEALEPIRHRGRLRWRLDDRCVEIDATTWHSRRAEVLMLDWSAQSSNLPAERARPAAVERVRDFLRHAVDNSANELADVSTPDMLRRLNAVTGDGLLTNAAALLLVGRPQSCLDYLRRDTPAGDSTQRVRNAEKSLVEQLADVFDAARANNPQRHVSSGLVAGQVRLIPERALREAIVNGVAHREWAVGDPTTVEHVGSTLRVSSPGGFVGGVTSDNIINHPSKSRNTALTELLAAIKVAEREGVGVDRMVSDMLRYGHRFPEIREHGSGVVTSLVGGQVDLSWMAWLDDIGPSRVVDNLHLLMAVHLLVAEGWIDESRLGRFLQLGPAESNQITFQLCDLSLHAGWVVTGVDGVPDSSPPAYALSTGAIGALKAHDADAGVTRRWPTRQRIARSYARARGRISSTELASLVGAHTANVQRVLHDLEKTDHLAPSRPNRRGAGFYYMYVGN